MLCPVHPNAESFCDPFNTSISCDVRAVGVVCVRCVCGSVCVTVVEMWEREGAFTLYNGPRTPQYKHYLCPGAV